MKLHFVLSTFLIATITANSAVTLNATDSAAAIIDTADTPKLDASSPAAAAYTAYEKGEHSKAVEMATPLAEKGDKDAIYLLGFAYENGQGVEASREKAIEFYRKGQEKIMLTRSIA